MCPSVGQSGDVPHRRDIAALFTDLHAFTPFVEASEPEHAFATLTEYQALVGAAVQEFGGTVLDAVGDMVFAVFNDPVPVADPEIRAVRAAIRARDELLVLTRRWAKRGDALGVGIGVHSGFATFGHVTVGGLVQYRAIGTTVIVAARLAGVGESGAVLVTERVLNAIGGVPDAVAMPDLQLRGVRQPLRVFALRAA